METEIMRIDPKEFGLEEQNVKSIEQAFLPKIAERDGLEIIYKELITSEITEELCARAKDIRNKFVKVRTGIAAIHKTQKAFFWASGKFVDAWKNKETLPVIHMEEKLLAIEEHFENLERERIQKLHKKRKQELEEFDPDYIPDELGLMDENVWYNFRNGVEMNYKQRLATDEQAKEDQIKAERKAELYLLEQEAIKQLEKDRIILAAPLSSFIDDFENIVFADLAEHEFANLISNAWILQNKHEQEQDQIKIENERLKQEADKREKTARIKEQKREQEEKKNYDRMTQLTGLGLVYNGKSFVYEDINFHWTDIVCMEDIEFNNTMTIAKMRMNDIKHRQQQEKQKEITRIESERLDRQRIEDELRLKKEAEDKIEADKQFAIEIELNKGDADKKKDLLNDLEHLKTKYSFKSKKNQKMYSEVYLLLDKIKNHIK